MKDTAKIKQTFASHGCKLVKLGIVDSIDVQYFLAANPETKSQVISIRGTANLEKALVDMKIKLEIDNHAGINLHRGLSTASRNS